MITLLISASVVTYLKGGSTLFSLIKILSFVIQQNGSDFLKKCMKGTFAFPHELGAKSFARNDRCEYLM